MLDKILYVFLAIAIVTGVARLFIPNSAQAPLEGVACTMDAMVCPDGSSVGRTGPKCEFVCPELSALDPVIQADIEAKADLITVSNPQPYGLIRSGDVVTGQARGNWFFEGSFPLVLTNWDGLIIAEAIATAEGEWMTTEFVPFKAVLTFNNDFVVDVNEDDGNDWPLGSLIFKKDNPSGLPEKDDALEIPIRFAP